MENLNVMKNKCSWVLTNIPFLMHVYCSDFRFVCSHSSEWAESQRGNTALEWNPQFVLPLMVKLQLVKLQINMVNFPYKGSVFPDCLVAFNYYSYLWPFRLPGRMKCLCKNIQYVDARARCFLQFWCYCSSTEVERLGNGYSQLFQYSFQNFTSFYYGSTVPYLHFWNPPIS